MAHYPEMEDEEEEWEETPSRSGPRFGPLVTIAAAILVLFGAASRLGKPMGDGSGLFGLDLSARTKLEEERLRLEEQRQRTVLSLGAQPVPPRDLYLRSVPPGGLNPNPSPPYRGDFNLNGLRPGVSPRNPRTSRPQPGISGLRPDGNGIYGDNYNRNSRFDPAPEAVPTPHAKGSTYTVEAGDTWIKIGQRTGKRWQDIQNANPASRNGLRVGMKLILP